MLTQPLRPLCAQSAYEVHEADSEAYRKEAAVAGVARALKETASAHAAAEARVAARLNERSVAVKALQSAEGEVEAAEAKLTAAMSGWEGKLASLRAVEAAMEKDQAAVAALQGAIGDHDARLVSAQGAAAAAAENARKVREAFPLNGVSFPRM